MRRFGWRIGLPFAATAIALGVALLVIPNDASPSPPSLTTAGWGAIGVASVKAPHGWEMAIYWYPPRNRSVETVRVVKLDPVIDDHSYPQFPARVMACAESPLPAQLHHDNAILLSALPTSFTIEPGATKLCPSSAGFQLFTQLPEIHHGAHLDGFDAVYVTGGRLVRQFLEETSTLVPHGMSDPTPSPSST